MHGAVVRQVLLEPAQVIVLGHARADEEIPFGTEIRQREVADQPPVLLEHRRERHAPDGAAAGRRAAGRARRRAFTASSEYFAKLVVSMSPTRSRTARTSSATVAKSVDRMPAELVATPAGAYHSGNSRPAAAPNCAPARAQPFVQRRGPQRPSRRRAPRSGIGSRSGARSSRAPWRWCKPCWPSRRNGRRPWPRRRSPDRRARSSWRARARRRPP